MISIVMPVWNGSKFLDRAIASVLAQTSHEWELVVVDDASTDDSVMRIDHWRCLVMDHLGEEKIRLLTTGVNSGSSVAQNMGVKTSRYDVITYLHCDDILFPRRVESLCHFFYHQNTEVDLLFAPYEIMEKGRVILWNLRVFWEEESYICSSEAEREPPFEAWARSSLQRDILSVPLGVANRRKKFEEVGGFQPRIVAGADGVLWRRMADRGARIGFCPVIAGRYFVRADSQARTKRTFATGGFEIDKSHPLGPNGQYLDVEWFAALEKKKRG